MGSTTAPPNSGAGAPLFAHAAQPDVVRGAQKDTLYLSVLSDACHEAVRGLLGPRRAMLHSRAISCTAVLLYHGLTTGCGSQTLGEEYCDILQVSGPAALEPGILRRGMLVALQAALPIAAARLQEWIAVQQQQLQEETELAHDEGGQQPRTELQAKQAGLGQQCRRLRPHMIRLLEPTLTCASRLQLALFYFSGDFFTLAHRLTGVRYLFIGRMLQGRPTYRALGYVLLLQVALSLGQLLPGIEQALRGHGQRSGHAQMIPSKSHPPWAASYAKGEGAAAGSIGPQAFVQVEPSGRCALCLSARRCPTSTSCGHVFCWRCICEWCNQKAECPLCRSDISTSTLVPVFHAGF